MDPAVTFFVGENGSGKSTLIEAIAVACGFNAEGGSRNFSFATRASESDLQLYLQIIRNYYRERTGYFLRAESVFNVATQIEVMDSDPDNRGAGPPIIDSVGGVSLHEQSHGESFLAIANNRFGPGGLYILDEPEAALSPSRQIAFLKLMHDLVKRGRQLIVATHSPILMALPGAKIFKLDETGISQIAYEDTDHYRVTLDFLANRETYIRHLFAT
jgi:predicted ATPase